MPIKRFADELRESGQLGKYLELLVQSFNARNVDAVMCRGMVHVAYDGARRGAAARVRWVCKPACLAACLRAPLCCVCFVCAPARLSLAGPLSFSLSLSLALSLPLSPAWHESSLTPTARVTLRVPPSPPAGSIHDCDFNYSLQLTPTNPAKRNVFDLRGSLAELSAEPIRFSHHCWGCVAGAGSS
jgi:hypothetical protein